MNNDRKNTHKKCERTIEKSSRRLSNLPRPHAAVCELRVEVTRPEQMETDPRLVSARFGSYIVETGFTTETEAMEPVTDRNSTVTTSFRKRAGPKTAVGKRLFSECRTFAEIQTY